MSRVLHRSGSQKTTLSADVLAREQRNFINDTEIAVQRRQTAARSLVCSIAITRATPLSMPE